MKNILFSPPDILEEDIDEVVNTLRSGWITTGPKTKLFEKMISNYCETNMTAALNSATSSIEMTLRVLGIGRGDEVITTAYTYSATASAIYHVGASVKLIDTKIDSFHIDYEKIKENITGKTKAIIAVDIGGVMCDYDKIFDIVHQERNRFIPRNELQKAFNRIIVISDSAHSLGSEYHGKKSGNVADFTIFSFHAVKNLTTGEGGAVTWRTRKNISNVDLYKKLMILSLHGQSKDALQKTITGNWEYDIVDLNYKCNMTDIAASLGINQLKRYPKILEKRKNIINFYNKMLSKLNVSWLEHYNENNCNSSGHLYMLRINDKREQFRNKLIKKLSADGVPTNVHFKPLPLLSGYKKLGFNIKNYRNSYFMYENEISLPVHTNLNEIEIEYIINRLIFHIKNI